MSTIPEEVGLVIGAIQSGNPEQLKECCNFLINRQTSTPLQEDDLSNWLDDGLLVSDKLVGDDLRKKIIKKCKLTAAYWPLKT